MAGLQVALPESQTVDALALSVIQELAALTASGLDIEGVVNGVYHAVSRLMDTTNFYIALYEEPRQELFFCLDVTEGQRVDRGANVRRPFGAGLTEYVITSRAPLLIEENLTAVRERLGIASVGKEGAQSWLGVPLMIGERVIGVMTVQSYTTPRLFGPRERDLLMTVANQAAVALENARLTEQQARRLQELAVLNEAGLALAAARNVEEVFHIAHTQLERLFDASSFYIALADTTRGVWISAFDMQGGQRLPAEEYTLNEGLTGYIIRTRETLHFNTAEEMLQFCHKHGFMYLGPRAHSWLATPLLARDRVIGVLGLENYREPFAFDEHAHTLIETFAISVANALQNVQWFEQLQQQALQEQQVRAITERILAAPDTQAIVRVTLEGLRELLEASTAVLQLGTREQLGALVIAGQAAMEGGTDGEA